MRELNNKELLTINGGASWFSASFLNAAARAMNTLLELGRSLGSSIRRSMRGKYCKI